mmetsp:Transcript_10764/g.34579  ORF Transcript_10764/g.34579 Transcript_10764/m.34579 type:complete len:154 (+) Transcript_10764:427-888(+)
MRHAAAMLLAAEAHAPRLTTQYVDLRHSCGAATPACRALRALSYDKAMMGGRRELQSAACVARSIQCCEKCEAAQLQRLQHGPARHAAPRLATNSFLPDSPRASLCILADAPRHRTALESHTPRRPGAGAAFSQPTSSAPPPVPSDPACRILF